MKLLKVPLMLRLNLVCRGVLLASMLGCSACNKPDAASARQNPPPGRNDETWKFWEAFNKAAGSGHGTEVLQQEAWQGDAGAGVFGAVMEELADGEHARSRAIASLPVLHVDSELAAYAVEVAQSRVNLAIALRDYVALVKKQSEMTSMPVLGAGILMNLLNHSDDPADGILWRALIDQAKQTSSELQSLKEPAKATEAKALAVRGVLSHLNTEEMSLRITLAQRYGREFPPHASYAATIPSPGKTDRPLSEKQIVESLIGRKSGGLFDTWTFESPREFVSVKIVTVKKPKDLEADYEVLTHVKGLRSGAEHDFRLQLKYAWLYTRWILVELQQM